MGSRLIPELLKLGHEVVNLGRTARATTTPGLIHVTWDARTIPAAEVGTIDGIINLAGANVGESNWTAEVKKRIVQSRLDATKACVAYIKAAEHRPSVFISASAVGYYGTHYTRPVTEADAPGSDFLATTCKLWEAAAEGSGIRTIKTRIGVVMAREGGAFPKLLAPFRLYAGGYIGTGKQGFPWVHIDDVVGALVFLLTHPTAEGVFNLTAPDLTDNKHFGLTVGRAIHKPAALGIPTFIIKALMGERHIIVTEGQFAQPQRLLEHGYTFKYTTAAQAVDDLLRT